MSGKRRNEISLMNVALCFFVIYIHVASGVMGAMNTNTWQYVLVMAAWKLAACAVPGFFFLSALKLSLSSGKEGFSYPKYILSRIKRVWLPYAVAAIIYFLFFVYCNYMEFDLKQAVKFLFDGNLTAHFYFVIAIMQFYLLAPLWRWLAKKLRDPVFAVIAVVSACFVGTLFGQYFADFIYVFYKGAVFPYSDRLFTTYIFWWVLGLAVGQHYEAVKTALSKHLLAIFLLFAFSGTHNVFLTYIHLSGKTWVYWLETAHTFYVVCAITFMLALSVSLSETALANNPVIRYIDRSSYSIYLWHPLWLYLCQIAVSGKELSFGGLLMARTGFAFLGTITVCVLFAIITEQISGLIQKLKERRLT